MATRLRVWERADDGGGPFSSEGDTDQLPLPPLRSAHCLDMADRASLAPLTEANAAGREQSAVVTERAGPNEEAGPRHGVQRPRSRGAPLAKDQSNGAGEGGVSREAPAENDNPPRLEDGPARTAVDDDPLRLSDGDTPPVVDDDPLRLAGGPAGPVVDGGPPRLADTPV